MNLNIPAEWRELLSALQTIAPGTILAGGALRDLDNNKPIKDLDFFVPHGADFELIEAYLSELRDHRSQCVDAKYFTDDHTICRVREYSGDGLIPANVVEVDAEQTPAERSSMFDFGLCQIWFDGEKVSTTDAYHTDKQNQTLTLIRDDTYDRSMKRFDRITEKYVGWKLVVPETTVFHIHQPMSMVIL